MRKILIFALLMTLAPLTASATPLYLTFEGHTSTDSVWRDFDKDDLLKQAGMFGGGEISITLMIDPDYVKKGRNHLYYTQYISSTNDTIVKSNYTSCNSIIDTIFEIELYAPPGNSIRLTLYSFNNRNLDISLIGKPWFEVYSRVTTPSGKTAFYEATVALTSVTTKPPHAPVPEPATCALLLLGLLGVGGSRQIRRWRNFRQP